jgi:hypothetical protein
LFFGVEDVFADCINRYSRNKIYEEARLKIDYCGFFAFKNFFTRVNIEVGRSESHHYIHKEQEINHAVKNVDRLRVQKGGGVEGNSGMESGSSYKSPK